ncbi:MAG: hypothetical protein GY943_38510, partial [Chloroflexi bacterium]|nr:hypothetical protein [Chloroflexota bacterium]
RLAELGLPPIISPKAVAVMLGVNLGILWSIEKKTSKYYRQFPLKTGQKERIIHAPKVVLKSIQKWLSVQLQDGLKFDDHVYGFVPRRSHIQAAQVHVNANWVYSVDIEDFFPTTRADELLPSLLDMGFGLSSAEMVIKLCCLSNVLPQGASYCQIWCLRVIGHAAI